MTYLSLVCYVSRADWCLQSNVVTVLFHLLSPRLFSAALVESGFPFAKPISYSLSQSANFSSAAGCPAGGTAPVIECLQQCSLERLTKTEGAGGDPFTTPGWGYVRQLRQNCCLFHFTARGPRPLHVLV